MMRLKWLLFTFAFLLLLLSCNGPSAETDTTVIVVSEPKSLKDDPVFWDYAASSNMLQTQLGQLAMEKGTTEQVRALGEQSVKFHTRALKRLKALVRRRRHIHLPDSLEAADQGLVKEFEALEGPGFDDQYRAFLITSHTTQLQRYQEAMGTADDPRTRQWLLDMEAHLRQQLQALSAPPDTTTAAPEE